MKNMNQPSQIKYFFYFISNENCVWMISAKDQANYKSQQALLSSFRWCHLVAK